MLEELLDHIIAEDVRHQLHRVGKYLFESLFLLIAVSRLKLLLDESGTVLIATEFDNVSVYILCHVSKIRG